MGRDMRAKLADDDAPTMSPARPMPEDEDDDFALQTNRDADHNTIVDMNLRTMRFVIVVAAALIVAFSYALITSRSIVLAHVLDPDKVESQVAFYNVLLGAIMFTSGKVFEIYTDTLIFPTLHTYLHNCSLYPGDDPHRTTSKVKSNAIFWGLKTVLIFMNVGTASLFVSHRTRAISSSTRALSDAVEDHARRLQDMMPVEANPLIAFLADAHKGFGISTTSCLRKSEWTSADVDYTSVGYAFAQRAWSREVAATVGPSEILTTLTLQECVQDAVACELALASKGINPNDFAVLLSRGVASKNLQEVPQNVTMQRAVDELSRFTTSMEASLPREATIKLEKIVSTVGLSTLSATVSIPQRAARESIVCGAKRCVLAVDAEPQQFATIEQVDGELFTSFTTRDAIVTSSGEPREILSFTFARHRPADDFLPVDLGDGDSVVVSTKSPVLHRSRLVELNAVLLPYASGLKTWLPLPDQYSPQSTDCDPLVDAYITDFSRKASAFSSSQISSTLSTATLLFLAQDAAYEPSQETLAFERRLAEEASSSTEETVQLTLSVTQYSAYSTFFGCAIMVVLTVFVIVRPTARVRLTPNTTPAAQYVQILTDDLYPNIVHKKRLRFVNGEVLPFNEYVVDSIVLHAKRDSTKKIFLSH